MAKDQYLFGQAAMVGGNTIAVVVMVIQIAYTR